MGFHSETDIRSIEPLLTRAVTSLLFNKLTFAISVQRLN